MAIFEMFEVDKDIESIILKSPTELDLYNATRKKGVLTMKEDALIKAIRGDIPITEVYKF
jgi:type II secretory ATPase GspE/PulE/Tfp pilus assembly ATPase PilB-like protein